MPPTTHATGLDRAARQGAMGPARRPDTQPRAGELLPEHSHQQLTKRSGVYVWLASSRLGQTILVRVIALRKASPTLDGQPHRLLTHSMAHPPRMVTDAVIRVCASGYLPPHAYPTFE